MGERSFLPATPALEADPAGDDAGEDEDHPDEHDQVSEVLTDRERTESGFADVREVVLDEIEEQPEGDHDGTELREPGQGRSPRRARGRGRGGRLDRHGHRSGLL
jgi:hypothetical protein